MPEAAKEKGALFSFQYEWPQPKGRKKKYHNPLPPPEPVAFAGSNDKEGAYPLTLQNLDLVVCIARDLSWRKMDSMPDDPYLEPQKVIKLEPEVFCRAYGQQFGGGQIPRSNQYEGFQHYERDTPAKIVEIWNIMNNDVKKAHKLINERFSFELDSAAGTNPQLREQLIERKRNNLKILRFMGAQKGTGLTILKVIHCPSIDWEIDLTY